MTDQKNEKEPKTKGRVGYGVKIPALTLERVIVSLKAVVNLAGENGSLDALAEVLGNSRSSSSFQMKLAAIKNFGVLSADKLNFSVPELGRRIIAPQSPDEEFVAIQEAFAKHELLDRVWGNYKGKILPQREYLANYIEKTLDIPANLKLAWADYFIECARYARIINEREGGSYQVYSSYVPREAAKQKPEKPQENQAKQPSPEPRPSQHTSIDQFFEGLTGGVFYQKKLSRDRKALIFVPEDLTNADVEMIRSILKSVDAGLDGLKESQE